MSAYSLARQQLDAAIAAAAASNIEPDDLLRAMLATLAERYRIMKGSEDLRAVLQFQIDNSEGDEDYMFMRP